MADHIHIASTRESNYREKTLEMMTDKGYANYVFYQVGEEIFAALRDRPLPVRRVDDNVQILTQQDLEKQILSQKSINQQQASAYKTASYTSRPNVPSREHQSKLGDKEKTKEKQGASNRRPPPDPPKDKIVKPEEKAKVTQKIEQPRDLLTILDEATKHSQNERSEKKFKQGNIDNLANDLEKLGKQFEEFFGHKKDSLKQSNDPQYREILEQKRKDLMIKIDELENRYPTCQNAILTLYTNLDREENIFSFYQERIIASEINRQLYFSFIISDMDKNHSKICERFFPNIPKDQHHLIKFSIVKEEAKAKPFLDGETHNEGKSPMLIRCTMNDQVLKDLVYKPRDGRMDQAVMSLFKEINNLSPHSHPPLSTCEILTLSEESSLWEFVDGTLVSKLPITKGTVKPGLDADVSTWIKRSTIPEKKKIILLEKLNRLDKLLTEARFGDLHPSNVIIRGLDTDDPEIVIIDLENRQEKSFYKKREEELSYEFATGLGGNIDSVTLSNDEKTSILKFHETVKDYSCRFILLDSQKLTEILLSIDNIDKYAKSMIEELKAFGFTPVISVDQLKVNISLDVINNDIPYFTQLGNVIYYGNERRDVKIAEFR